jgi:hypothetical protein
MNVRFGYSNDAQALGLGGFKVLSDVTSGVNDERLAALLATDKVRGMSERLIVKIFEKHGMTPWDVFDDA